ILDELRRRIGGDSGPLAERRDGGRGIAGLVDPGDDVRTDSRYRARELVGAARRFAEPERDRRRLAVRILDANASRLDAPYLVRRVSELEDVAGEALDGPVLVHGADDLICGLQDDLVVGGIGNCAAGGDRGEPRTAPAAQHAVDRIAVNIGCAVASPRRESFG